MTTVVPPSNTADSTLLARRLRICRRVRGALLGCWSVVVVVVLGRKYNIAQGDGLRQLCEWGDWEERMSVVVCCECIYISTPIIKKKWAICCVSK